ncbi:MAG: Uma2 family endonuclease [Myxococcota bacterium]
MHKVPWEVYASLREAVAESGGVRMTYLDGTLEIMNPSRRHEHQKKFLARLMEAYGDELRIPLLGFGSETFKDKAKKAGLEPDECYCVGTEKELPDFAVEVALRSVGPRKLEVYARLRIPEVWLSMKSGLHIYRLVDDDYEEVPRSAHLPDLDPQVLGRIVSTTPRAEQAKAVWAFRDGLRQR